MTQKADPIERVIEAVKAADAENVTTVELGLDSWIAFADLKALVAEYSKRTEALRLLGYFDKMEAGQTGAETPADPNQIQ